MKRQLLLAAILAAPPLFAQEAVVIGTGNSDQTYAEGVHESEAPVAIPAGANRIGITQDITDHLDPDMCSSLNLMRHDGAEWRDVTRFDKCGGPEKTKAGGDLAAFAVDVTTAVPVEGALKTVLTIRNCAGKTPNFPSLSNCEAQGFAAQAATTLRTSSTIRMREIQ